MTEVTKINYMDPKWLDSRGGNVMPNSWSTSSENPTLFNVVYHFMWDLNLGLDTNQKAALRVLIQEKHSTNGGEYRTNNNDTNPDSGFSLDESIAVAAASFRYLGYSNLGPLKIFTKNTWFRPYDVCMFLAYCKYSWVRWMFVPQMMAAVFLPWYLLFLCIPVQAFIVLSIFSSTWKDDAKTSGKQLNFVQYFALQDKFWARWTWALVLLFVDYEQVFSVYYPEKDHPINFMARGVVSWKR